MRSNQLAAAPRSISGGALMALALGLGLYQLSALSITSAGERVIPISLQMPSVELQQVTEPLLSDANAILGSAFTAGVSSLSMPLVQQMAVSVVSTATHATPTQALSTGFDLSRASVERRGDKAAGRAVAHYHDADERSPGLARRR
jgi:hypothetical protein